MKTHDVFLFFSYSNPWPTTRQATFFLRPHKINLTLFKFEYS